MAEAPATSAAIRPQPGPQEMFLSSPADIALFGGAAFGGKMLALDTPIATPFGWTTMGDLRAGDTIFADDGRPCKVVAAHPVNPSPESYLVTFDDGERIKACGDHLWRTLTAREVEAQKRRTPEFRESRKAKRPKRGSGKRPDLAKANREKAHRYLLPPVGAIRTTAEIFRTLKTPRGRANHMIESPRPLELPHADLPIDPYLLGVWLGDGTTTAGAITTADPEIVLEFRSQGFEVKKYKDKYGFGIIGFSKLLRESGLLGNKHVPARYLRASFSQRLALLQGLMDTDGCSCLSGGVEFTSTNRGLADAVVELAHTFGQKANVREGRATLYGKDCGPKYRVKWTCNLPAFRLKRKLARQRFGGQEATRFRYIHGCERIAPVPMRCITVDSPSRLYLAGKSMVPTHNTFSLLLECGRHVGNPAFSFTVFRRTTPQITNQGALWDESFSIFPSFRAEPILGDHSWRFPSGAKGKFSHLEEEKTIYDYDGSQIPLIGFDQLEQFTEKQFFYMLSRNRSGCGVRPYVRATANPPGRKDHWLRQFVDWWIGPDGYPIPERSGVLRYFIRDGGAVHWVDKDYRDAEGTPPKSFTFISAKYTDNVIGLERDPGYVANLNAQSIVDRARLKDGNWDASDEGGLFGLADFKYVDRAPPGLRLVRYWDRAATEVTPKNKDPDWTAGALCGIHAGQLYVVSMEHFRAGPSENERRIRACANADGLGVEILFEQEGGSSGKDVVDHYQRNVLKGYIVRGDKPTGDKVVRAKPWCALAERGNVVIVRGPWNANFVSEVSNFPNGKKDQVDAVSGAYKYLSSGGDYSALGKL